MAQTRQFEAISYTAALSALRGFLGGLLPETRADGGIVARRMLFDWSAFVSQRKIRRRAGNSGFLHGESRLSAQVTLALLEDIFGMGEDRVFFFAYIGIVLRAGFLYRRLASRLVRPRHCHGIFLMMIGIATRSNRLREVEEITALVDIRYLFIALTAAVVGFAFLTPSAQRNSRRTPRIARPRTINRPRQASSGRSWA